MAILYSIKKDERLVVFSPGGNATVHGPGKTFVVPFFQSAALVNIATRFMTLPEVRLATVGNLVVARGSCQYCVVDPIKASNKDIARKTREALHTTLSLVFAEASLVQCLKKHHHVEKKVLDRVNEPAQEWGVTVSSVRIVDVPLARSLAGELAWTLTAVIGDIVRLTDQGGKSENLPWIGDGMDI